jgi:hypothetical protein
VNAWRRLPSRELPNAAGAGSIRCREQWTQAGFDGHLEVDSECDVSDCTLCPFRYQGPLSAQIGRERGIGGS